MGLSSKVTSFSTGTGAVNSTIDVTLGFQPKAIWVWWSGRTETTDTVARADSRVGWGFGYDSTHRCCTGWARQNGAAAETGAQVGRDDSIVSRLTTAGVADGLLDIDATANWPVDGIRFITDGVFGASMRIHIAAIGGSDITNVDWGTITHTSGTASITSLSYEPDVVIFGDFVDEVISTATTRCMYGAGVSVADQYASAIMFDPGSTTGDGGQYLWNGTEIFGLINNADPAVISLRSELTAMLVNGFQITRQELSNSLTNAWMTIKGGQWALGNILTQTNTSTDITASPSFTGMTPALIMFESGSRVESTVDVGTTPTRWSRGAATGASEEGAQAEHGEQGSANTRVGTAIEFDSCYINLANIAADGDPQTIQGSMHVTATAADSFTCRMTVADPSQSFVAWVAVAPDFVAAADKVPYVPTPLLGPILAQ